jgi:hypothetical protein
MRQRIMALSAASTPLERFISSIRLWCLAGWIGMATLLLGCGGGAPSLPSGVPVSGTILLPGGGPVSGGVLVLRPVGGVHGATAAIQPDGKFTLKGPDGREQIVPGKYQVFVRFPDDAQKALRGQVSKKYQDTEDGDSDLIVEIAEATSTLKIQLKK